MSNGLASAESGQHWKRALVVLVGALSLETMSFSHVSAFVPLYLRNELFLSEADTSFWTGLIAAAPLLIALPLAPFWGAWADRHGSKLIIVRSQIVELIVYLGVALAGNLPQFIAATLLLGFTYGNVAVVMAMQVGLTPRHRIGLAISIVQAALPFALAIGPLIGSLLIERVGLRGLFVFDAVVAVVAGSLIVFGVEEPSWSRSTLGIGRQIRATFGQAVNLPTMRWTFMTMFFLLAGQTVIQPYIPILLGRYFGGDDLTRAIGLVLGSAGVATVIVTPIAGLLGDRAGHHRIAWPSLASLVVIHLALFFAVGPAALIGLLIIRTAPQFAAMGTLNTTLAIRAPASNRAALMSLAPFPRNLAMFVGPALAALVSQINLNWLFFLAAGLLVGGVVSATLLHRTVSAEDHS